MAEDTDPAHATTAVAEVPDAGHGEPSLIEVKGPMVGLTWLTFGLLALILYKIAWKPILSGLDKREEEIRKALEEARLTREEYARIDARRQKLLGEAEARAKTMIDEARQAAIEAAAAIEAKARQEQEILLDNARREIMDARAMAVAELRRESADLAIGLSRKIIGESLDEQRSRELVDRLIRTV